LTFAEKMRYNVCIGAKSLIEFSNSKTQRHIKSCFIISHFFCEKTPPYRIDTARVSSGFVPPVAFVAGLLNLIHGPFLFLARQTLPLPHTKEKHYV